MAKRYMSESEYEQQQFRWRHNLVDPHLLQSVIDGGRGETSDDDEDEKLRKQELRDRLWELVKSKIDAKVLTDRQREAIKLFLMSKKQEHMGQILGVTQEAANVRLRLGLERLRKACKKDEEVQEILSDIKK